MFTAFDLDQVVANTIASQKTRAVTSAIPQSFNAVLLAGRWQFLVIIVLLPVADPLP